MITPLEDLAGWHHLALDAVGSTNTEALQLGEDGNPGNLWVTANQQLTGKARRGREWVSKPGNLYASLLLINPAPAEALVTLPLVASLALHKALVALAPKIADDLRIKWPNDVLLKGKKLSGILLEASRTKDSDNSAVVIGIGVNCQHFPENPLYPATSLLENGYSIAPAQLFKALSEQMAKALDIWQLGQGFATIRKDWLERATGLGENITARFPDHEIEGRFVDIDADGFLLMEDNSKQIQKISAADIFFGNSVPKGA